MKKYKVSSIAAATGLSYNTIASFACSRGWSTKGGLDLMQILAVLNGRRRESNAQADPNEIEELRDILIKIGAIDEKGDDGFHEGN